MSIDFGVDLAAFLSASVEYLSPVLYSVVGMAFAIEIVWQGLKWAKKIN